MPEPWTPSTPAPPARPGGTATGTAPGTAAGAASVPAPPAGARPAFARPAAMTPADAVWLRDLVRRRSAIVLDESKQYLLDTRLAPVVRSEGLDSVGDLVARARAGDRRVVDLVVDAMTTNETSWFRDNGPFEALRTVVLPALVRERAAERSIRIWSAACSSGQEAYSIAMICTEVVPPGWTVDIVGTDLSPAMVQRATAGRFSQLEVNRGMPAASLVRWFERDGSHWQVSPQLRRMTRFREGNLAEPFTDLGRFDVVMLRNVLIYFDGDTKCDILRRTRAVTRPDGYLFLGAAETALGLDVGWAREQVGTTSVLRLDGAPPAAPPAGSRTTTATTRPAPAARAPWRRPGRRCARPSRPPRPPPHARPR
ncbi:CheR family methyltransferase [Aquipuribacter hungaricus]|uniref:CheR family methyltransferase n=1 Tax=Aquipuribacter hungaricus TaxID=545624 RepID=UPI003619CDB7